MTAAMPRATQVLAGAPGCVQPTGQLLARRLEDAIAQPPPASWVRSGGRPDKSLLCGHLHKPLMPPGRLWVGEDKRAGPEPAAVGGWGMHAGAIPRDALRPGGTQSEHCALQSGPNAEAGWAQRGSWAGSGSRKLLSLLSQGFSGLGVLPGAATEVWWEHGRWFRDLPVTDAEGEPAEVRLQMQTGGGSRCDSVELDDTIRVLIERGASPAPEGAAPGATARPRSTCSPKKEKESPDEELHELKRENKLLREKNAAVNRKKEHYECEIRRLNQALQDALKIEGASFPDDCLGESEKGCGLEEMRTEMEVLKQQVQIYEEDFRRERADRERLGQEKQELQQSNRACQAQLHKLKSKLKACQMEKETLERQLKQVYLPTCCCGFGIHLRDPSVPAGPGAARDPERHPISPPKRKSPSKPCARAEGCGGSARPGPRPPGPWGSCPLPGCVASAPPSCAAAPSGVDREKACDS
ncbi:TNFAIP3-interacting protein 3 [Phyllostomus discolor]|uniref:TNFAIP3-interacting protein 3 n=1 Tax=Phyllostomus discolor TaxID=89673 RepID=A0A7E6EFL2_9CHIR|nr:TNFAIP3-interacting protein 3 [Phyllostomus discolor]